MRHSPFISRHFQTSRVAPEALGFTALPLSHLIGIGFQFSQRSQEEVEEKKEQKKIKLSLKLQELILNAEAETAVRDRKIQKTRKSQERTLFRQPVRTTTTGEPNHVVFDI